MSVPFPDDTQEAEDVADNGISLDVYGVKVRLSPGRHVEDDPRTWSEVLVRLNRHLMTIVEQILGLPTDVVRSVRSLVRTVGGLKPDRRINQEAAEEGRKRAVLVEAKKQEMNSARCQEGFPANFDVNANGKAESVGHFLAYLQLKPLHVEVLSLGGGAIGIIVVQPELADTARSLLKNDSLLSDPLSILELKGPVEQHLSDAGVTTVGELVCLSEADVLSIKGIEPAALANVTERLNAFGFELRKALK